jgi:putative FmdB family regulatory protein
MPLIEYGCYECGKVSESLVTDRNAIPETTKCEHCDSDDTVKLVSTVNFKMFRKAKYDDDFLGKALPAMRKKKETAEYFAEGSKSSDEAKMFEMGEQIGSRIDRMIERNFPRKK